MNNDTDSLYVYVVEVNEHAIDLRRLRDAVVGMSIADDGSDTGGPEPAKGDDPNSPCEEPIPASFYL